MPCQRRGATVENDTVIGAGTKVGQGASIKKSVIGRNVTIGPNVEVEGSYIWDGAVLEEGCTVHSALVCRGAKIGKNAQIQAGAVVSFDCVIGDGFVLDSCHKVTKCTSDEIDASDESDFETEDKDGDQVDVLTAETSDRREVGTGGLGRLWVPEDAELDAQRCIGAVKLVKPINGDSETEEDSEEEEQMDADPEEEDDDKFHREAMEAVTKGFEEQTLLDNITLEINSSKFAYNKNFSDCVMAVVHAMLLLGAGPDHKTLKAGFQSMLKEKLLKDLLGKFMASSKKLDGAETTQFAVLTAVVRALEQDDKLQHPKRGLSALSGLLQILFDVDICEEENIIGFFDKAEPDVQAAAKQMTDWLQQSSASSEEEDEE